MPELSIREDGRADARSGGPLPTSGREFYCRTCGARCTRGTDGTEYGHRYGCPERPDELPTGDSSEFDRYQNSLTNGGTDR